MESSFWGEPSEDKKIWWQLQRHIRSLHLHVSVYTLPMMKIDRFSCQNKRHCMAMEDFWESARAASWPSWIPGWRQGRVSGQTDVFAETLNRSSDDRELSVCFPRSDQISIGVVKVKVWRVEARKQMFLQTYYEKFARAQVMRWLWQSTDLTWSWATSIKRQLSFNTCKCIL